MWNITTHILKEFCHEKSISIVFHNKMNFSVTITEELQPIKPYTIGTTVQPIKPQPFRHLNAPTRVTNWSNSAQQSDISQIKL